MLNHATELALGMNEHLPAYVSILSTSTFYNITKPPTIDPGGVM